MKFVHAADLHLDSPLRGLARYDAAPAEELRGATRRALENLVRLVLAEEADALLLAGDVYDGDWRDHNTGLFFAKQLAVLREAGVRVFVVAGNHDAASAITRQLRLPDNAVTFPTSEATTVVAEDLGLAVHGQGYATRAVHDDLAAAYPAPLPGLCNVGLLHTSLDGREGHAPYAPCVLGGLVAKGYDYWALGHVHEREVVAAEPSWVVFPGNLQGRHANEAGPKGATLVTVDDGAITSVEHRDLDAVRWSRCAVDAAGATTADDVVERVRRRLGEETDAAGGRLVAARVVLEGRSRAHEALWRDAEALEAQVRAAAVDLGPVWVEKVRLATRPEADHVDAAGGCADAVGAVVRALRTLRDDDAALVALGVDFAKLREALPAEAKGPGGVDSASPDGLRLALGGAEELLVALLAHGEAGRPRP